MASRAHPSPAASTSTRRATLGRLRDGVQRHGLRHSAGVVARRAAHRVVAHERHLWYELDLEADCPSGSRLPPPLRLRRLGQGEAHRLRDVQTTPTAEAERLLRDGSEAWIVEDGDANTVAFACWVHRRREPMRAARGGALQLPPGTACLEDTVTAPSHRGRGIAPAAWAGVAETLRRDGLRRLLTKVATDNVPSRRAVGKAGFVEVALMDYRRSGPLVRVTVEPLGASPTGALLAQLLER
jgi:RimJ/RimL family protein N-acetyltransferase